MSKQHPNVKALREFKRQRIRDGLVVTHPNEDDAILAWATRVCEAADNLGNVKGRHHSEVAYRRLDDAVNAKDSGNA